MTEEIKSDLTVKIEDALLQLRPFFEADGGNMELAEITNEGVAKIRLVGACADCSMSEMTLRSGVEEAIKKVAPEITAVEAVV